MKTVLPILFILAVVSTGCHDPAAEKKTAALEARIAALEAKQAANELQLDYLDKQGGRCVTLLEIQVRSNANAAWDFTDEVYSHSISNAVKVNLLQYRFDRLLSNNPSLVR